MIEKRGNSYRVRKMFNGKAYSKTFDHKPTEQEIFKAFADVSEPTHYGKNTFEKSAKEYIKIQNDILSPSTIRGYDTALRMLSERFKALLTDSITQVDIQTEVKFLSQNKAPKTVKNYVAFISAVLAFFRPDFNYRINLPQPIKYKAKIPTEEAIKGVFELLEGTEFSIPIKLACLGLRRGEIAGLSKSDLQGNELYIHQTLVQNTKNEWVKKNTTKTYESTRTIYVPNELAEEIRNCEKICSVNPSSIARKLGRTLQKLGYEKCRAHDLRHYYISYAHNKGMSDADIIASVGHKTDHITKTTYLHSIQLTREEKQKEIAMNIFN